MTAPRILIVDDQRDITRMLRAAIDTLGRGYEIVDVPSAEEALLEIRRGPIELLITDLRLPGITGLELVRRLRNLASQAQMIVISAYADERTRAECQRLGATFFEKPLSLADFLAGVQTALGAHARAPQPSEQTAQDQPSVADRLSSLRADLGALAVFLVDLDGKVVMRAGEVTDVALETVLTPLMMAFSASLKVSRALGSQVPANLHFFDGDRCDVYTHNVGRYFGLVIFFAGDRGASQMGAVMRFGRACADDLLGALRVMGVEAGLAARQAPVVPTTDDRRRTTQAAAAGGRAARPEAAAPPAEGAAPRAPSGLLARRRTGKTGPLRTGKTGPLHRPPAAARPAPAAPPPAAPPAPLPAPEPPRPLTPEQIAALDEAAKQVTREAAQSFWDNLTAPADDAGDAAGTLSWEQAEKLGLFPGKE